MHVSVSRNFGPLTDFKPLTIEDWSRIGRFARERIVRRTSEGRDENDQPFAPYSPAYAEAKAKAGGAATVDLMVSGDMLRAITVEPDANGVTLGFSS